MSRLMDALASSNPAAPLIVGGDAGSVTRGAFLARVETLAEALSDGSGPVGVALDNSPDWLVADLALAVSGRVSVPVPPWFTTAQLRHLVSAAGLSTWLGRTPPPGDSDPRPGPDCAPGLWELAEPTQVALPVGTAKITFTSGTTGQPKGVCLSQDSMETIASSLAAVGREAGVTRHLCVLPLPVLLENVAGAWAALLAGADLVVPPMADLGMAGATGVDPARFLDAVHRHAAESLILVPQLLEALVGAIEAGGRAPASLRFVAVGGARVPPALLARARELGLPVFEGYGLSESGSVVSLDREADGHAGVGRTLPHARVRLAPDGEILVDGELMLGYAGDPSPVPRPWPTGDLGTLDADGRLHIVGRKRNVFITPMGRNVSPEWVETELVQEAPVRQAAVFGEGLPHPVAVLVAPGADAAAVEAAVARANRRLPDYARVGDWILAEEPFTPSNGLATPNGRIRRDDVAARYASRITARPRAAFPQMETRPR